MGQLPLIRGQALFPAPALRIRREYYVEWHGFAGRAHLPEL